MENGGDLIKTMIDKFLRWLRRNGYQSFDQYDFWSTTFGRFAKRMYYRNRPLASPFVTLIFATDLFVPTVRALFVRKKRFPIADAHFTMGFLNLYQVTREEDFLEEAQSLGEELLKSSIPGFSGHCWGYPFTWETVLGTFPKSTPLITTTPYCYEAFCNLYDTTKAERYLDIAYSISKFAMSDIKDTKISESSSACSYSPVDSSKVVNANTYRAFLLLDAFQRFGVKEYKEIAEKNINFVLQNQQEDGSWYYEVGNQHNRFVDNFHTCFVLKNLHKANAYLKSPDVENAVSRGYAFYRSRLFTADGLPKPFAHLARMHTVDTEMYDIAEGIALGVLLRHSIPGAAEVAMALSEKVRKHYQSRDGHFLTRINIFGIKHSVPYLRWPQAQMFHALTLLLRLTTGN